MTGKVAFRPLRTPFAGELSFCIALFLVALLPRLFVAIAWSKEPVWDGHYYHFGAERIAEGLGYSEDVWSKGQLVWKPWVHYPVGYSALLAPFYALFGASLLVAPLLNALAGAALAVFVLYLSHQFLGSTRARIAGALVALHPGLIVYSALVMTEIVSALLLVLAGWVALSRRGQLLGPVGAGALFGLAALVRPTSLLLLPLMLFIEPGPYLRRARGMLVAAGCALVVILPWTVRNCRTLDGCALISTNGGWNLAIGAISRTGRFETLRASDGCRVVSGQVQQDRCWRQVGLQKIASDPAGWLKLAPKKLGETFNHESFAIEYLHEADPVSWTPSRRAAGRELLGTFHRLLLIAAALGVIALPGSWRERPVAAGVQSALIATVAGLSIHALASDEHPFFWLALFIPLFAILPLPGRPKFNAAGAYVVGFLLVLLLTHVVFFGEDRYHLVATPILCILAAAALRPIGSGSAPASEFASGPFNPPARAPFAAQP